MGSLANTAPGVYWNLQDKSRVPVTTQTSVGAIVFGGNVGPLTPQYISNREEWNAAYGPNDHTVTYAHDAAYPFLKQSSSLWGLRIPGIGALYATALIANNLLFDGKTYDGTTVTTTNGSSVPYSEYNRDIQDIVFNKAFATGHKVKVAIGTEETPEISFAVSHANTMNLIAQAVQTVLDNIGSYGSASVIPVNSATASPFGPSIIRVVSPEGTTMMDIALTLTGTGAPSGLVRDSQWLYAPVSNNPGAWGKKYGIQVTRVDPGVNQKVLLKFGAAFVAGNDTTLIINGVTIGPVTFASSSNATLDLIVDAINDSSLAGTVKAHAIAASGSNNNRQITLEAANPYIAITIEEMMVSGGASQPSVSHSVVISSKIPSSAFTIATFNGINTATPVNTLSGTLRQTTKYDSNQQMDYQYNHGPEASVVINLAPNPLMFSSDWQMQSATAINYSTNVGYLGGGEDGEAVTTSQIIDAWDTFLDTASYPVDLLINAGYTDVAIQQKMDAIAQARQDCIAILDAPRMSNAQALCAYRNTELGIDSSFSAMYTPWPLVYDTAIGARRFAPPSGFIAQRFAYTDKNAHEWFSNAGLKRGIISECLGLSTLYVPAAIPGDVGDLDLLQNAGLNPIVPESGRFALWGDNSLQYDSTYLQSIAVRRLCNTIRKVAMATVKYSDFDPNDQYTRDELVANCTDILQPIKDGRGISKYEIICDGRNNPATTVDARNVNVMIIFTAIAPALRIILTGVLTAASSNWTEIIQQGTSSSNAAASSL